MRDSADPSGEDSPIAAVVDRLLADVTLLVRQEAELARLEQGAPKTRLDPRSVVVAAAVGAGLVSVIAGLSLRMPLWLAALVVCAACIVAAVAIDVRGRLRVPPRREALRAEDTDLEAVRRWAYERGTSR